MPRILRSPASKSFRLENVSVPNADNASCERRRITAALKRMAGFGFKSGQVQSDRTFSDLRLKQTQAFMSTRLRPDRSARQRLDLHRQRISAYGETRAYRGPAELSRLFVRPIDIGKCLYFPTLP